LSILIRAAPFATSHSPIGSAAEAPMVDANKNKMATVLCISLDLCCSWLS
jgi:hypothetical protein